jgi:hypothetical protein
MPDRPPSDSARRIFLAVSGALLIGWFAWLSYTALTKSHEPILPRVQAAAARVAVRATVDADDKGAPLREVTVVEALLAGGPGPNEKIIVMNLPTARGFGGKGDYLLFLDPDPQILMPDGRPIYHVLGARGTIGADTDPPTIYAWVPDVAAQAKRLLHTRE